jgi:FlaA1/EpsC-like NDP-sugar epimerase
MSLSKSEMVRQSAWARVLSCLPQAASEASPRTGSSPATWPTSAFVRVEAALLRVRDVVIFAVLCLSFTASYPLAYLVRFEGAVPPDAVALALRTLPLVVVLKLAAFLGMGSHRGGWCFPTLADMITLAEAATLAAAALVATCAVGLVTPRIPYSVVVIDWAATILLLGGLRVSMRLFREHYYPMIAQSHFRRVLVIDDTSEAGLALVRGIHSKPHPDMRVVGVLDYDRSKWGRTRDGVKVLGSPDDIQRHVARLRAELVLIPTPAIPAHRIRSVVDACGALGVKVQVVPGFDSLLNGQLVVQPRDVDINDLLCREPVRLDAGPIGELFQGRVVLVTGAAGSIGSELCRQCLAFGPEALVVLDHSENGLFQLERELLEAAKGARIVPFLASVTDPRRLQAVFARHRPAVVFHAAAHKHVPMMESNPGEAVRNNVFGTRTLVDAAVRAGVEVFVMISTDKAVNPTSVMGASKRVAEMYVQALSSAAATRLVTVRFGNVLGSNGSVVPIFKDQIRRRGVVTVTHPEMTRYFMTIPEATQLVLQAGALGRGGEIFVLDMGKPVKVLDLAKDLIRLSGLTVGRDIAIDFTGLRPGEKLHEELYDRNEERLPTPHPKIFRAMHRPSETGRLLAAFERLAQAVDGCDEEAVVGLLKELVPEYRPGRRGGPGPEAGHEGRLGPLAASRNG